MLAGSQFFRVSRYRRNGIWRYVRHIRGSGPAQSIFPGAAPVAFWHHQVMSSVEHLAQAAYEAHRGAFSGSLPAWEDAGDTERQAWKAAVSTVAGQTGVTLTDAEAVVAPWLQVQVGDQRRTFKTEFTAGRQGSLAVSDDFASNHHARFHVAHGCWYVKDLGSTNGTWLNGRRIHADQRLKKGDKVKIGHTIVTVMAA